VSLREKSRQKVKKKWFNTTFFKENRNFYKFMFRRKDMFWSTRNDGTFLPKKEIWSP
jgi:hypothetical protein